MALDEIKMDSGMNGRLIRFDTLQVKHMEPTSTLLLYEINEMKNDMDFLFAIPCINDHFQVIIIDLKDKRIEIYDPLQPNSSIKRNLGNSKKRPLRTVAEITLIDCVEVKITTILYIFNSICSTMYYEINCIADYQDRNGTMYQQILDPGQ